MRSFIKHLMAKTRGDEKGFTLVEMLVVTGIIVALAAIIVPLVISFSGSGEEAAQDGEFETMQTAIQTMMVDNDLSAVIASSSSGKITNSQDWDPSASVALSLLQYVDNTSTKFCYTWSTTGLLTAQFDVTDAGACTTTQTNP